METMTAQEKRAACVGKRPKSREETPKEGSDNAKSDTAPQQYATALHKTQVFLRYFQCKIHRAGLRAKKVRPTTFHRYFSCLSVPPAADTPLPRTIIVKLSNS